MSKSPFSFTPKDDGHEKSASGSLVELVTIVAIALGLALLIQAFVVKPFRIPSESMVPTLTVGQRILVNRVETHFGTPQRGDILVFKPPVGADRDAGQCGVRDGEEYLPGKVYNSASLPGGSGGVMVCPRPIDGKSKTNFVKRVVGLPGERLKIVDGHAVINGKPLDEPYINDDGACEGRIGEIDGDCNFTAEVTIPKDHYFMMGDNRGASADSRFWGPIPKDYIIGQGFLTYWPPKRVGTL